MILALSPCSALLNGLDRRAAVFALAPAALFTAIPKAYAGSFVYDPLTTMSRLEEATKKRRLSRAAAKALTEVQPEEEAQEQPTSLIDVSETSTDTEVLSTPAGLAKVDVELNVAYGLAEDMQYGQLRSLLRTEVFASFLGFAPVAIAPELKRKLSFVDNAPAVPERQLQLLSTFPAKSRLEAAETLGKLITKLADLDDCCVAGEASLATQRDASLSASTLLADTVSEARGLFQQFSKLFLADGCLVCADERQGTTQADIDESRRKALIKNEPVLLRRPDYRVKLERPDTLQDFTQMRL